MEYWTNEQLEALLVDYEYTTQLYPRTGRREYLCYTHKRENTCLMVYQVEDKWHILQTIRPQHSPS